MGYGAVIHPNAGNAHVLMLPLIFFLTPLATRWPLETGGAGAWLKHRGSWTVREKVCQIRSSELSRPFPQTKFGKGLLSSENSAPYQDKVDRVLLAVKLSFRLLRMSHVSIEVYIYIINIDIG